MVVSGTGHRVWYVDASGHPVSVALHGEALDARVGGRDTGTCLIALPGSDSVLVAREDGTSADHASIRIATP